MQVEEDQKNLSESVASKYDKLWHEVVTALEKMNSTELRNFQAEVNKRSQQSEQRVQQLVSYAIGLATRAARDRREADVKKAVISRWKERAWIGARQRMACRSLSRLFRIHLRRHFARFEHVTAWETQVNRLKQEFSNSLPDVRSIVRDTVKVRIDALENRVTEEQASIEQVKEEVERLRTKAHEFQVTVHAQVPLMSKLSDSSLDASGCCPVAGAWWPDQSGPPAFVLRITKTALHGHSVSRPDPTAASANRPQDNQNTSAQRLTRV